MFYDFNDFNNFININLTGLIDYQPNFLFSQCATPPQSFNTFMFPLAFNTARCQNTDTFERTTEKKGTSTDPFVSYNKKNGEKLSLYIKMHATGFSGGCAKACSDALVATKLSNGQRGHAWQMIKILRNNTHFKEVPISSITDTASIPKGAILVYGKGVCGYSKTYGHVEVAIGNGKAASDGIHNIKKGMPSAVFVPV